MELGRLQHWKTPYNLNATASKVQTCIQLQLTLILVMVKMQSLITLNSQVQPMHQANFSVGLLTSYGENTQSPQPNYSVPTTNYQASQMSVLVQIYILLQVQTHIK